MSKSGTYRIIRADGRCISEHKHIWEKANGKIPDGFTIHHINGNPRDNRIKNLRLLTRTMNKRMSSFGSIGKVGNKYKARRTVNGVRQFLGYYGTLCGAYMANMTALI
tara:strand:+ start:608 stop:931 length:324 start_codon:yes stop_codon:yes gene_type:complete